jgi:energy-coupling factor transporter ATP-binding protein EcfA2
MMSAQAWREIVAYVPAESGWWSDHVGDHFPADVETETLLAAVGMTGSLAWEVARLSTGERQRLAIARALIRHPKVLLLDEPTASLDEDATRRVEAVIQSCCRSNMTVLVVTHDHRQAHRLARQTLVMANGKICDPAPIARDHP